MRTRCKVWILVVIAGLAIAPAWGAEGRTPIYLPSTVITQPGGYYVTQNLTGTGSAPIIKVEASGVDIDLNGFTLTQPGGTTPVVLIDRLDRFSIHGGILKGGRRSLDWVPDGGSSTIEDVIMITPAEEGIRLSYGAGSLIRRVQVIQPGGDGIQLTSTANALVEDSVVHVPAGNGISLRDTRAVRILRCTVRSSGGHGISVDQLAAENIATQLRDNLVVQASLDGYHLQWISGGEIWENNADRCLLNGFHVLNEGHNLSMRGNHAIGCSGEGMLVAGTKNSIVGNHFSQNANYGLRFISPATKNMYGENAMSSNVGNPGCTATPVLGDFCNDGTQNGSFGNNLAPTQPLF